MKKYLISGLILAGTLPLLAQGVSVLQTQVPPTVPFAKPFAAQVELSHPQGEALELVKDSIPADFAVTQVTWNALTPERTQADLTVLPLTLQQSTFTATFALKADPSQVAQLTVPVTVTPVKLFNDQELKEIRPPHKLFDWALWLCILLALFALVCLLIWWVRRMKREQNTLLSTPKDNRPAHIIALSQLDALVDSGLWENKQYKVFYITLTDILRTYLQRAFGLDVSADTSAELLRRIKTQTQLASFVQSLRAFLASGDLVKFAKAEPTEQTRNQDILVLREFITQTAPKPKPTVPSSVEVKL